MLIAHTRDGRQPPVDCLPDAILIRLRSATRLGAALPRAESTPPDVRTLLLPSEVPARCLLRFKVGPLPAIIKKPRAQEALGSDGVSARRYLPKQSS